MKTQKGRQICDVSYFKDKKNRPVKAVVMFKETGQRMVRFTLFSLDRRARA
jgi:hypothetical protein